MRICIRCDSVYPDGTDECKECKDGGELIIAFYEDELKEK